MKWRAINIDGNIIEGETYHQVKDVLLQQDHTQSWNIEYYDSDNEWIELERFEFTPDTDEILVTRGSHKEHAA